MNTITVKDARNSALHGYQAFSHSSSVSMKSKSLTHYAFAEEGKHWVAYFIDESGEGEPIEKTYEGSLANAVLAYNGYDVEG